MFQYLKVIKLNCKIKYALLSHFDKDTFLIKARFELEFLDPQSSTEYWGHGASWPPVTVP